MNARFALDPQGRGLFVPLPLPRTSHLLLLSNQDSESIGGRFLRTDYRPRSLQSIPCTGSATSATSATYSPRSSSRTSIGSIGVGRFRSLLISSKQSQSFPFSAQKAPRLRASNLQFSPARIVACSLQLFDAIEQVILQSKSLR